MLGFLRDAENLDGRFQRLSHGRRGLYLADDVHAPNHAAEGGEALAVPR
jgi:hypothetical protein